MPKKKKLSDHGIAEIVHEVWPDGDGKLAALMKISRNGLWRLLRAKHAEEPVLQIETLHQVLTDRSMMPLKLTVDELRAAWRRTAARPKGRRDQHSHDRPKRK